MEKGRSNCRSYILPKIQLYFADANSQLEVLQMVAGKQAEVGIVEAPVIGCHKMTMIGAEFLQILISLGPLPPYRIMINKALGITFLYLR